MSTYTQTAPHSLARFNRAPVYFGCLFGCGRKQTTPKAAEDASQ
jgi:hypothetical protein